MAKKTKAKSGLGKGLSSLFGEAAEENTGTATEQATTKSEDAAASEIVVNPLAAEEGVVVVRERPTAGTAVATVPVEEYFPTRVGEVFDRGLDEVPIENIEANPDQPRQNFNTEYIQELAESIRREGLLQPILVRPMENGRYQIIAGERRWRASQLAGLEMVPVRFKEVDDDKSLELALIENIQRSDLNPIEEAYGYRRLMERLGMTQAEVAQAMSKGRSTIANALRLLELPQDAQELLFNDVITAGHARAILSIPDTEGRNKLTEKLKTEKLSVRETEALARLLSGKKSEAKTKVPLPASYKKAANELKQSLQRNVKVKTSGGKNRLEIEFADEEDLKVLLQLLEK